MRSGKLIDCWSTVRRSLIVVFLLAACGEGTAPEPEFEEGPTAPVTFHLIDIPDGIIMIDLRITAIHFETVTDVVDVAAGQDRITVDVPIGLERNVFARGFVAKDSLTHIGEADFDVVSGPLLVVTVPLNFKGIHLPFSNEP